VAEIPQNDKGLYKLVNDDHDEVNIVTESLTKDALHRRLGHISPVAAEQLIQEGLVTGLKLSEVKSSDITCDSCAYAKATRLPIAKIRQGDRATKVGEEVHTDIWGPARVATRKGQCYYITFTDDYSRWIYVEFLSQKSDAFEAYKRYEAWTKTQFNARIKILHSDCGGEYTSEEFQTYLKSRGMEMKLTVHDMLQSATICSPRFHLSVYSCMRFTYSCSPLNLLHLSTCSHAYSEPSAIVTQPDSINSYPG
jgi:hypothetical protein